MSVAMIQLFKDIEATPTQRLVAYMLADAHNEQTGRCDLSVASLATLTSLSERSIQEALKSLELAGHLSRIFRTGTSTQYNLTPRSRRTPADSAPPQQPHPGGANGAPPPPQQPHPTPATGAPKPERTVNLTVNEPEDKSLPPSPKTKGPVFPGDLPDDYRQILSAWWQHKQERKQGYKPSGWEMLVKRERRKPIADLIRDVEHSMAANYSGIFEAKSFNGTRQPKHAAYNAKTATAGMTPDEILNF